MKVTRIAGGALIASAVWNVNASRRRAAARRGKARGLGALLAVASGGIAAWAVRRAVLSSSAVGRPGPARRTAEEVPPAAPPAPVAVLPAAKPSAKKQRKRARQAAAEGRARAEKRPARRGRVKVEINQAEDLKAPVGELIKP